MLSYKEALEKILEHSFPLRPRQVPLEESLGLVLAEDLFALESLTNFDNSAVDGYTVSLKQIKTGTPLNYQREIKAGEWLKSALKPGHAVRIFTGAPIPQGTQAVVMQEHTTRVNGSIVLLQTPSPKENIRFKGED